MTAQPPLPPLARAALRLAGPLLAACLLGPGAAQAQHPNIDRGFTPSGMFATGGIDSVNGFNGNLVVRIPIGGSYPVGGTMGAYSFALMYNSRAWDFTGKDGHICPGGNVPTDTLAVPTVYDNAGLGWRFSLGSLGGDNLPYGAPPAPSSQAYHGMDGSEHYLFDHLTTPSGGSLQQPGMSFSNDGSFLRWNASAGTVELPDGMVHTFAPNSGLPSSIKDRFGNGLAISYTTDPQTCPGNVWLIQDGYRTHRVCFRPTGYPYPEPTQVVDHIDLAAPGGGTATYRFLYNDSDAGGNGFHEIRFTGRGTQIKGCGDPPWSTRVYLLTRLLLPDGTSYSMPAANYTASASGEVVQGVLTGIHLPTSGSVAWDYQVTSLPQPHSDDNGIWYLPVMTSVVGVSARRLYDSNGQLVGTWLYSAPTDIAAHWNEVVNQVVYPSPDPALASQGAPGHRIVTYYSACVYGSCLNEAGSPDAPDTSSVDYALPFSRRRPDGAGHFLSQEIYPPASTTPLRQIYLAYDDDAPASRPTTLTSPVFYNQRQQAQRTVYRDDPLPAPPGQPPANFTAVLAESSNYDSLGHYRTVTVSDTFGFAGTRRTERTGWNPHGMPGPGDPWILDTYDFKEQQEGGDLRRQETVFEPGTAFLLCQRHLAGGGNRGLGDVVVAYAHGGAQTPGQVTAESWFGGDTQTVSTDANCATLPANPVYTASHAYSAGVRNATTVTLATGNPPVNLMLLDDDVDAASGLVTTSRDPAGRPTSFTYDVMGRLLTASPQGDATTRITYQLGDVSPPVVDRQVGSPPLERETWQLDGLGRTVRHTLVLPNGVPSTTLATLNAMGWKTFVSVPAANPDAARGTRYSNYDPFGRPGKIQAPDNRSTTIDYTGARRVVRWQRVWNGTSEVPVSTVEDYDGLGRLRRIQDPNQTWTRYLYDAGGKLSTVTTNGTQGQTRSFHYDGRGFLVGESHPESGLATYRHDARGNVTLKSTPTGTLTSTYDRAGRLQSVRTPQGELKHFTYGTGAEAGQLTRASALNWRMTGSCSALEVRQDLAHDPATGRLASESTSLWQGPTPAESWTQSYAYDLAGRITQVNYPSCQSLCPAPPRQLTTAYAYGRPTAVPGFASAITYSDNATLATVQHANGVLFTQTPDPYGMLRPGSLRADALAGQSWPREDYFFDGAGNIKAIGTKTFGYDPGSRLTSATVPAAGAQPLQQYSFDLYGNLVRIFRGANPGSGSYVDYLADPATNRLQTASYDASGNLLAYQGAAYTWDVLGQATSTSTGAEAWTHTYDAAGERVWSFRTAPSRLDTYALRGPDAKVLTAFTKTGATYTWEDYAYREGQLLGAAFSDGRVTHFDVDHLGSVRLETDGRGAGKYRDFWPYGEEATPPSGSERMKFTGHERDLGNLTSTADDLDYMHARYYRPIWGRFLSPDPILEVPRATRDPQLWNRYAYGSANPMKYLDPTGAFLEIPVCSGIFDCMDKVIRSWIDRWAPPPKADPKVLEAQGYADQEVTSTTAINPIEQAGQVQGALNNATAKGLAAGGTVAVVGGAMVASEGAINVFTRGLEHISKLHTVLKIGSATKSTFRAEENIVTLIKAAASVRPIVQANGNLRFVVNAGRAIGYDYRTGGPTSFYTVITDRARNLVTAFPGLSSAP